MLLLQLPFKRSITILLLTFLVTDLSAQHNEYYPDPDTAIQKRLEEWQDLKFGLMMHWGTYSQWGIIESWSLCPEDHAWNTVDRIKYEADNYNDYVKKYEDLQTTFNPVKFNPEKWAAAAKEAGMKYMVFTAKHHDGFAMYDTKYTDYKITDKRTPFSTNPRSNITKEIFSAFRKENFWIGAYFSKPDWHSNDFWWKRFPPLDRNANYSIEKYPERWKNFVDFTHNQINELTNGDYGKLDLLWLDGGWVQKRTEQQVKDELLVEYEGSRWHRYPQSQDLEMPRLVKEIRVNQPKLIVVDRGVSGEQQNYLTPEQHIPEKGLPYPWETCMTMSKSWSYIPNDVYKSTNDLIENLVDIVSKGGNYLLNIGPGPDGEFDTVAYQRLKEIGTWIKVNGEAIYGSKMYSSYNDGDSIRYTSSKDGSATYIFLFKFPADTIQLSKIGFTKKTKLKMLGSNSKLSWKQNENAVTIAVPASLQSVTNHVWVIKVEQ